MPSITKTDLPEVALLQKYRKNDYYTDCFVSRLSGEILFPDYVYAFYTTLLFKTERTVLKWFLSMPSTDDEARQLAEGTTNKWAAWTVEDRAANQLLLKDIQGRTRSWFMSESYECGTGKETRLYFGSAIAPDESPLSAPRTLGLRALISFHKLYSIALFHTATAALRSNGPGNSAS